MDLSACVSEECRYKEGVCVYDTLMSDTLYPNGHTGTDTRTGGWFHNKPTDLSVCVSDERGHEEGGGVYATLMSDTLHPNGRVETGTRTGVWL